MDDSPEKPIPPAVNDQVLHFSSFPLHAHVIRVWWLHSRAAQFLSTVENLTSTHTVLTSRTFPQSRLAAPVTF